MLYLFNWLPPFIGSDGGYFWFFDVFAIFVADIILERTVTVIHLSLDFFVHLQILYFLKLFIIFALLVLNPPSSTDVIQQTTALG